MAQRGFARLTGALRGVCNLNYARRVAFAAGGIATVGTTVFLLSHDEGLVDLSLLRKSRRILAEPSARPVAPPDKAGAVRVDPDTEVQFPISFTPTTSTPPLHFVGLGVRKVSFLRVKVYSAAFYVEESVIKRLHHAPGWHNYTAQHLLTPPTTTPSDPMVAPQMLGESLIGSLLDQNIACAVKIVPVRNTDFSHLRDGFTRALAARQKLARSSNTLSDSDDARISDSIQSLKSFFPSQKVPKGDSLTLIRTKQSSLLVTYEDRVLGEVRDPWVARELMLAYFADKDVISPKLKEDVAHGFEELMK